MAAAAKSPPYRKLVSGQEIDESLDWPALQRDKQKILAYTARRPRGHSTTNESVEYVTRPWMRPVLHNDDNNNDGSMSYSSAMDVWVKHEFGRFLTSPLIKLALHLSICRRVLVHASMLPTEYPSASTRPSTLLLNLINNDNT